MQDLSNPKPRVVEASQVESEDTAEDAEELLPSRDELDVAKYQVKQDEIDSLVLTSLESFLEDERYRNDPKAALLACREAARGQSGKSTLVKQMEEAANRILERVLEALRKHATNTTANTGQLQTPNQSEESGGSRPQVGSRPTQS